MTTLKQIQQHVYLFIYTSTYDAVKIFNDLFRSFEQNGRSIQSIDSSLASVRLTYEDIQYNYENYRHYKRIDDLLMRINDIPYNKLEKVKNEDETVEKSIDSENELLDSKVFSTYKVLKPFNKVSSLLILIAMHLDVC